MTWPGAHVTLSPGRHVMLQAAHVPTAGTLHDAPTSTFAFAPFFLAFSVAIEGLQTRTAAIITTKCAFVIFASVEMLGYVI
jgi:hypothetical protein